MKRASRRVYDSNVSTKGGGCTGNYAGEISNSCYIYWQKQMAAFLKKLEVKPTEDEYESIETTRWGNKDVYPIPHDKRVYGVYAFASYWGKSFHGLQTTSSL